MKQQVFEDLKQAMRDKDTLAKGVLTLLKAGLDKAEKEKGSELTNQEAISVVQREIKQTKQAYEGAVKANREDLIENEKRKIDLLEQYLPAQMDESEAIMILNDAGVKQGMNMGDAMKIAKPLLTGKIENAVIAKLVKAIIQ